MTTFFQVWGPVARAYLGFGYFVLCLLFCFLIQKAVFAAVWELPGISKRWKKRGGWRRPWTKGGSQPFEGWARLGLKKPALQSPAHRGRARVSMGQLDPGMEDPENTGARRLGWTCFFKKKKKSRTKQNQNQSDLASGRLQWTLPCNLGSKQTRSPPDYRTEDWAVEGAPRSQVPHLPTPPWPADKAPRSLATRPPSAFHPSEVTAAKCFTHKPARIHSCEPRGVANTRGHPFPQGPASERESPGPRAQPARSDLQRATPFCPAAEAHRGAARMTGSGAASRLARPLSAGDGAELHLASRSRRPAGLERAQKGLKFWGAKQVPGKHTMDPKGLSQQWPAKATVFAQWRFSLFR